jgi:hypothetical protein
MDENGFGLCGNACTDLKTASNCGGCGNGCAGNACVVVTQDGLQGICGCGAGDCSSGEVCVGDIIQGSSESICQNGAARFDIFDNRGVLNAFGQDFPLCNVSTTEAQMLCASDGQTGGATTAGTTPGQGFEIDCTGVSSLEDCVYAFRDSCTAPTITCGAEPPPNPSGDLSCATRGEAFLGTQTGSLPSGTGSRTSSSCGGDGREDVWFFTPSESRSFTFDTTLSSGSPDTVLYVMTGDCAAPSELLCNDQANGTSNPSLVTVSLTAGVPVLVVVDDFTTSGLSYTLRIQ